MSDQLTDSMAYDASKVHEAAETSEAAEAAEAAQAADTLLAVLFCPECAGESPHKVAYKRGTVVETVCCVCGRRLAAPRRPWLELCDEPDPSRGRTSVGAAAGSALPDAGGSVADAAWRRPPDMGAHAFPLLSILSRLPASSRRLGALAVELPMRAMPKPGRLWREVRRDGPARLLSVPRRAATKPVRLVAELAGLRRRAR